MSDYENGSNATDATDDGPDTIVLMAIFCSVAFVLFGTVYCVCWYRGKENQKRSLSSGAMTTTTSTVSESPSSDQEQQGAADDTAPPQPQQQRHQQQFTQAWSPRERQPGEPIFDRHMICGTISLGVLMLIGATVVVIMSVVDRAQFKGATVNDFRSLGADSCRFEATARYSFFDERQNALNTLCVEQWEFVLEVINPNLEEGVDERTYFISAPLTEGSCYASCDLCEQGGALFGLDYYAGYDPLKRGYYVTNESLVECWAPTKSNVEDLSDFYNCGTQRDENGTCFLLQDTAVLLEEEQGTFQIALLAAYVGFGGGVLLLLCVGFFMYRNKRTVENERARQAALLLMDDEQDQATEVASIGSNKSPAKESDKDEDEEAQGDDHNGQEQEKGH